MNLDDMPMVLLPAEVAAVLRCSKATVYELVRTRKLQGIHVSGGKQGGVRITKVAIQEFLGLPVSIGESEVHGQVVPLQKGKDLPPTAAKASPFPARPGRGSR